MGRLVLEKQDEIALFTIIIIGSGNNMKELIGNVTLRSFSKNLMKCFASGIMERRMIRKCLTENL